MTMAGYILALKDLASLQGFPTYVDEECGILHIMGKVVNFAGRVLIHMPKSLQVYKDHIYIDDCIRLNFGGSPLYLYGQFTPIEPHLAAYIGTYYNGEFVNFNRCKYIAAKMIGLNRHLQRIRADEKIYAYNHGPCFVINPVLVNNIGTVTIIGVSLTAYYVFESSERVKFSTDRIDRINIGYRNLALLKDVVNDVYVLSDSISFYPLTPFRKLLESGRHVKAIEHMFIDSFKIINEYAQKN